jgi:hypothetical protein
MRDVHLREVDLNLSTLYAFLEERHLYAVPATALCALNNRQKLRGQHWADITNPEFLRKGLDVDITPFGNQ